MKWTTVKDEPGHMETLWVDGHAVGCVEQFHGGAPYYGTWEGPNGGRTGPMGDLDECKRRVEAAVRPN